MIFSKNFQKLITIVAIAATTMIASADKFKVATVDMGFLIRGYHRFKAAQKEQAFEVQEINKQDRDRQGRIRAIQDELKKMAAEINDPSLSPARRQAVSQAAQKKQVDLQALERERELFLTTKDQDLNLKMESLQNDITLEVMDTVNEYAATQDVDFVFDESGISTSEVPFIIYIRNRVDFTDAVLKILNKDAPKELPEKKPEDGE